MSNTAGQTSFSHIPKTPPHPSKRQGLWHKPLLMNFLSDALLLAVFIALGYAALNFALYLPLFTLSEVKVVTPLKHVTLAQIEYASASLHGNFFTVNLDQSRLAFEKLPWVKQAQLRKKWPGTIEVTITENQAVAYWENINDNSMKMLDPYGNPFEGSSSESMPTLSGSPEHAPMILEKFKAMSQQIKPLNLGIEKLTLTNRMAWELELDNGMTIKLGKEREEISLNNRLARFVRAYPLATSGFDKKIAVADLRYPNGFAIRLATPENRGSE